MGIDPIPVCRTVSLTGAAGILKHLGRGWKNGGGLAETVFATRQTIDDDVRHIL